MSNVYETITKSFHMVLFKFFQSLFSLFYQVIKLTASSKATRSSSSQLSKATTLMLLFWATSSFVIVVSLSVLNCGLEKMVLSQLGDGSFIFFIIIFPETLEGSLFVQVVLLLLQKQESLLISFKPLVGGPQKLSQFIFVIILPSLLSCFAIIQHYAYHHPFLGSLLLVSNMHFLFIFSSSSFSPSLPSYSLLAIMRNALLWAGG